MVYEEDEVEEDKKKVAAVKAKWTEEEIKIRNVLAMLVTAIFDKFLGEKFFVLRPSEYDELVNKVTHIIIDKETGEPVCFYAEVGEIEGQEFEERVKEVLERNLKGGAKLKYGVRLKRGAEGKRKIIKTALENIPVFYLALPVKILYEAIEKFGQKEDEETVFNLLLSMIQGQIQNLKQFEKEWNCGWFARGESK